MATSALPDTILRAETYYQPPPPRRGQPVEDWSQVPGAELVYRWVEYRLSRRVPVPTGSISGHPGVYAWIDDGRWITECECKAAWIVSVEDPRFGCPECKADWVPLIVPEDIVAAEAAALALPYRFWWHPDDPRNPYAPEPEMPAEPEEPVEPEEPTS
ncbi:hypothetical protein AB0K57_04805 [Streptomyces halstedii]|uniref:hypothetical protein n=1 Tax=Streptomyces halstedii TaxID=1944 RepID=UPI003460423D